MNWPAACAVIIPCLNEARAISEVVRHVRTHLPGVVVVDDGSVDDTAEQAARAGATVLRNSAPTGKGAAMKRGWNWAAAKGSAWVLTMDGDGQHAPEDIPKLLQQAERTGADLVIGNRMVQPDAMPGLRRVVNRWMSRRISRRAGCELPDTQCGFRLIRLSALAALPVSTDNFEIESEVLLAFARAGRRIEFVPIQVIYKSEQSKIHPFRDTMRWLRWWRRA